MMKIISGKVIAVERVLSEFNNEKAFHATGQKVSVKFFLDNGKTYWSDNHIDNFKVGSYVEFYGGEGYNSIYINQDTAKALIKEKRVSVITNVLPLVATVSTITIFYAIDKIWGKPITSELYFELWNICAYMLYMARLSYKVSNEPKGKDVKKLKEYAEEYNQKRYFLTPEDISRTSSVIKEKINLL